jgi:3-hydroxyisobutyrate dehydrogenase-like beta-hydroxyacid dehydrogenase
MSKGNVGVVSPGDMGQAVAGRLKEYGYAIYTALQGRSARTRGLAAKAGIDDCGSMNELVARCDMVWSILNPAAAVDKAREAAAAMQATGRPITYVDCNAIAPQTVGEIDRIVTAAGGTFIDAGIVGPPPRGAAKTRIYVSGREAAKLTAITNDHLLIRVVSERVGDASALKMCYAAVTKGSVALGVELLVAARKLGVAEPLEREFGESLGDIYEWLLARMVSMPPKAYRWVPEMNEISKTFEGVGMTPRLMAGAADMFEAIAATELGRESPEQARERGRDGRTVVRDLASDL